MATIKTPKEDDLREAILDEVARRIANLNLLTASDWSLHLYGGKGQITESDVRVTYNQTGRSE